MPSKLSVHLSAYPERTFDVLERIQPSVVKVFNFPSEMNIDAIRSRCPGTIIIYRQYTDLDYHSAADQYFAELGQTLSKLKGRGIFWEGINEPVVNSIADMQALNNWFVRFAELMHSQGEKVAGFSWSTGNPTNIQEVVPNVVQAATACDLHAFHEYYSIFGTSRDWVRYRAFEQALPAAARKPVVITEAGLDDNGDPQNGGFRGKVSYEQYLEILKSYDGFLLQDPYCLGATVFQWGDFAWPSFELSPIIDMLADYIVNSGLGASIPRPFPLPTFGAPSPTYTFGVNPLTILAGQSAKLEWDTDNVVSVSLDGETVANQGERTVSPTETTTYKLLVSLPDGSTKELKATLTVNPAPPGPTYSFSADPTAIDPGGASTLKWDVEGVREVYLDGQGVTGHETRSVSPTATTTYTLRVVLLDGSSRDLQVTVTIKSATPPPAEEPWDKRLDPLGIQLKRTDARPAWRLISAKYLPASESNDKHHVFFKALSADGSPMKGMRFVVDWLGRDPYDTPALATTDANGETNIPLWGSMHLGLNDGIYFAKPAYEPGDTVSGLGLPGGEHVSFVLTYQLTS